MSSLLKGLLGIVRACYETFPQDSSSGGSGGGGEGKNNDGSLQPSPTTTATTTAKSKKKSSRKKKKRKASEFTTSVLEGTTGFGRVDSGGRPVRKTMTRCLLASDALTALIKCLAQHPASSQQQSQLAPLSNIRSHFQNCLYLPQVLDLIKLGYSLEDKLARSRLEDVVSEYCSTTTDARERAKLIDEGTFEPWERQLWLSHVQFCLTVGRGGAIAASSSGSLPSQPLPCLDGVPGRLAILRSIVNMEKGRRHMMIEGKKKEEKGKTTANKKKSSDNNTSNDELPLWPLALPAAQHALISSLVVSSNGRKSAESLMDDIDDADGESPEDLLFICDSFLNSLEKQLNDLSQLPASTVTATSSPTGGGIGISSSTAESSGETKSLSVTNYEVPLSLRDARLFVVTVLKLSSNDMKRLRSRCIDILHKGLHQHQQQGGELSLGDSSNNAMICHFIARAMTLCSTLIDVVTVAGMSSSGSSDLRSLLMIALASSNYSLP